MAYLHTSGAISFSQLQSHFGGGNPIYMSEYYRNGSYVPSIYTVTTTTTTTTRSPGSGSNYSVWNGSSGYEWRVIGTSSTQIYWGSSTITTGASSSATSYTSGGWTYYRSTFVVQNYSIYRYRIYRQQTTTSTSTTTTNINTGIPSSGTISMNQFYGGQN